ncbi:MAG: aminopeptidase P family protein [Phycisphaerae bacterium]|nr:aminopeptidase P family protein [Phycisphaerae bacterium]
MAQRRAHRSSPVIERRLEALRTKIQQKLLDGYLINSRVDQYYATGFDGEDGAVLILPRSVHLLTDGRFIQAAAKEAPWASVVIRRGSLVETAAQLIKRCRLVRLGFNPGTMSLQLYRDLGKAIRGTRLVPMPAMVHDLRLLKDSTEVAAIEKAAEIAESAFLTVTRRLRLGMTERQVAADLQWEMLRRGASDVAFPLIVAEGPNASLPHAVPGDRRIRSGSLLLIDWGATWSHYRSDLTRVVFIHKILPRFRRMYEHVLAAQAEGIRAIRPGVRMCDVDRRARGRLKAVGLDKKFTHGLGHGLGLDVHEAPRLAAKMKDALKAGMVVTVEPGVYCPGLGGVRIEDDVLVTEGGCRVLTRLAKDLDSMVV